MSNNSPFLKAICDAIERFLDDKMTDKDFVNRYEDLMADHLPEEITQSGAMYRLLDNYLMQFAFFQHDPQIRADGPNDLYGPEELRHKAESLLRELRRLPSEEA